MQRDKRLLYLGVLLKLVLPFLIQNGSYEPHRDEFLYLAEARHMAWGYMEIPPLLSLFAWLTNLFGGGLFWIKLWPSLFGALTFLVVGRMVLSLGGKWFALVLSFLPFIFGALLRMNYLFQPNFLDIFFWTLMAYGLVRYFLSGRQQSDKEGSPIWLYLAGLAMGLGMMSKYSMAFYATGLIGGILLTGQRRVLRNRHFWYAMGMGLLLFLPNLFWQWAHGFPVVYHMNELQQTQLQYVSPMAFLSEQLLFNLPVLFVWLSGLYAVGFTLAGKPYRFIGWAFVIVMVLLVAGHGKGYYAAGVYPVLFGFGAVALEQWTAKGLVFLRYFMLAFTLFLGYTFVTIALPFLPPPRLAAYYADNAVIRSTGSLRWEDQQSHPLPQDFADMLSWKEMTQKVAKAYATLNSVEKKRTLLFCDNYGQAGAVNYYGPQYHLPPVYSANASFLYWMPEDFYKYNILLLVTADKKEMQHPFVHEFASAEVMDSITNPFAREYGSLIIVFKGPSPVFRKDFREKIDRDRRKTTASGDTTINALEEGGSLH
jgi:hypothetical protein